MTFVYPLLLGGLLLAGLPVLLHFLIRKKPKVLLFPAFRFLVQKQRSNTRNLRLKHLLLLLLRMAMIVLVCLALARPRLFHEALGISRERPAAMVLVFDTSPSMEYKVGETTRLDLAKARCLEFLDQLPEDCRVLMLDAADPASFSREDWAKSLEKARQRIQGLAIRPQSAPVSKAVEEGLRRFEGLDEPGTEKLPRLLCVFSDRTKASWDSSAAIKRPEDVKALYFDVGIDEPVDVAIVHVELPRDFRGEQRQAFTEGERIELRAVVKATGKDAEGTIHCEFAGKKETQAFNVKAGDQQTVTFMIDTAVLGLASGYHVGEIKLDLRDELAFNNQRFVTIRILDRPRILVLSEDLKRTEEFAQMVRAHLYDVDHRSVAQPIEGKDYQSIFLVGVAAPTETIWQSLSAQSEKGRGLCIVPPGDEMDIKAYRSDAALKVLPGRIDEKVEAPAGVHWDLEGNDLQHPFLRPLWEWRDRAGLAFLTHQPRRAMKYWRVVAKDPRDVVLQYDDGSPAILERLSKKSKVLLLTTPLDSRADEWNTYRKNLHFFLTLTRLCGRHLGDDPEQQPVNFVFGSAPPSFVKSTLQAFPKYLLSNGEASEEVKFDEKGRWFGDVLAKAGNYSILGTGGDTTEPFYKFSVNVIGVESDLTRIPKDDLEIVFGKDAVVAQDRRTPMLESLGALWSEPMELLPWLLLAVLLLLAIENLLANRFYAQPEEITHP